MIGFDTDILSLLLRGDPICVQKASLVPDNEQGVPIVSAEEVLRGRLDAIRKSQAGKSKLTIDEAYRRFERTIIDLEHLKILSHTAQAEVLVQLWLKQKIKVGISDLRIAAICVVHPATLITRNRRDFDQVPGLVVEYWQSISERTIMIHVIATITVKPGKREAFLAEFDRIMPAVHAEAGCIEYGPTVDVASGLTMQALLRENVAVIIEKWESLDALKAHSQAPHMAEYRVRVKDLVESVTLQILAPA